MLFFVAWVLQDWSKIAGLILFYFLGGSEFVAWVSHCILLWVPLMVGLGAWTAPLLGFLCKICSSFRGFCRREADMKKREIVAPSMLLQAFNIFGKVREMGRGERKRENGYLFIYYFANVSG